MEGCHAFGFGFRSRASLGNYMDDKAGFSMIFPKGQAGVSANLQIPQGLTFEDLEAVEDLVLEWKTAVITARLMSLSRYMNV